MKRLALLLTLLALAGCDTPSFFGADQPIPPPPRLPPLDMLTRMTLPASVHTVEGAARYLLEPTGYTLVLSCSDCPPEAPEIARKPVSPLALKPQLTSVKRALLLVAGSDARLLIDEADRQVSFAYAVPATPGGLPQ